MTEDGGFVARWSRRKRQSRSGETAPAAPLAPVARELPPASPPVAAPPPAASAVDAPSPPPTLEDVARLGRDSDFARFVAPGVDENVQRAAMKKLFTDPRFNVMDGLDTYIDDYGTPDPIPEAMLRRMAQSQTLRLFDAEPGDGAAREEGVPRPTPPAGAAATQLPETRTDEDTALRLQPDDAADAAGAGPHRPGARS
jgi:Protein of unknown function (DUF3306)